MTNTNPILYWAYLVALAFVALVVTILQRLSAARADKASQEEKRQINERIAAGDLLPSGRAPCVICGETEAKFALPEIGLSWFEQVNPLRSLYGSVKLYRLTRGDSFANGSACSACATLYSALLERELADMRRDTAQFAAEVDRRVSRMRSGDVILAARIEREQSIGRMRAVFQNSQVPLLASHHEELAVGAQTTNGKSVDDQPEMTN